MKTFKDAARERKMLSAKGMVRTNNTYNSINGCIVPTSEAKQYIRSLTDK